MVEIDIWRKCCWKPIFFHGQSKDISIQTNVETVDRFERKVLVSLKFLLNKVIIIYKLQSELMENIKMTFFSLINLIFN